MKEPVVCKNLVVGHSGVRVAGPVDMELHGGSIAVVQGPNGAGKTTFVRTLLGLLPPISGKVQMPPRTVVGYVPQHIKLDEEFPITAAECVAMGLPRRTSRREARRRIRHAMERVGMHHRHRTWLFALSGGQRQRILIARALAGESSLIALDEPTASLDPENAAVIWTILSGLANEGRLVIVITHEDPRDITAPHVRVRVDEGEFQVEGKSS